VYIERLLVSLNSWSIRSRLLLLVLLGVLPAASLLANLAWEYRTERIEATSSQALALARMIAGDQEEVVEGTRQLMKALAQMRWLRNVERSTCDATLSDLSRENPRYNAILLIDASGHLICGSSPLLVDSRLSSKTYFAYALANEDFAAGRMMTSVVDETAVLPFAARFMDSSGAVGGVVFVSLRLDWLGKVVDQLELPASAVLTVADRDGTVLATRPRNTALIGQPASWAGELAARVRTPWLVEVEGQLVGLAPVRESELYVGIAVPKDAVTATGDELFQLHLLIIVVIASVNLGLAWAVGELSIGRRVRALTAVGRELRNGNLKARPLLPPGGGELQVLQETFDHMAAELERREDELRRSAEAFRHQALHDELTGLPSRTLFIDRLGQSLAKARRDSLSVAVLALDLDHFKDVNDLLGHAAGDLLLVKVAERLGRAVRDCDTVARLGGDEFALIVSQISGPREAAEVAKRLQAQFKAPFDLKGQPCRTSTSIGITLFPRDATDVGQLLRCADLALYQAKGSGRSTHSFYAPHMKARIERRKSIEEELRWATVMSISTY
jgi:diguanylate cyclase (GGDEF)-like protein